MAQFAVVVETTELERTVDRLVALDDETIGRASIRAVNEVSARAFDESVKRMTTRVNLTQDYVRQRMDVEPANDPRNVEAKIIAFRAGGRRRGIRPVNLRQYAPVITQTFTNWRNTGEARNSGKRIAINMPAPGPRPALLPFSQNPRARQKQLPFILRTGNQMLNIPVGRKAESLSVEVLAGRRKTVKAKNGFKPFMQKMPSGEVLVMRRKTRNGGKGNKGRIEALYSLSVWQLFRKAAAEVIPIVQDDLQNTVGDMLSDEISKIVQS